MMAMLPACKHKKKLRSLTGTEPVEVTDFLGFFKPITLPFQFADSSFLKNKKENDSLLISQAVFSQFIPDSVFNSLYGKNEKLKIYALGKVAIPNAETYVFVKTVSGTKKAVHLIAFDKKQQYAGNLLALKPDQDVNTNQSVTMDRRLSITKSLQRKNPDGTMSEGKDVYSFSADAHSFTLIMTDALEDKPTELINPIDTLTRKYKYAADYTSGKMNLVSIRDGRRSDRLSFFIHFDKGKDCSGELKGEATIRSANTAEYNKDGDPCKLKFIFTSSSVTLKEEEGCGSYRPLNCSFNGSFAKKKTPKQKK